MAPELFLEHCRKWYARLLRLYPSSHRDRFSEGMEQTFHDLSRERLRSGRGVVRFALWMFVETSVGMIREHMTVHIVQNKSVGRVARITGFILLIPVFGNLFVEGWNWGPFDFLVAGALLFGTGLTYSILAKSSGSFFYKAAVAVALAAAFLLTWINLAVEIIGDNNPANLMYFGVPVVGAIGAVLARFQPRGMARALFATAFAQALVPVIGLMAWSPEVVSWSPGVPRVFVLNTFFVLLFAGSAFLFRHARKDRIFSASE